MNRKIRYGALLGVTLSSAWLLAGCGSTSSMSQQQTTTYGGLDGGLDGGLNGGPDVSVKFASLDGTQETPATGSSTVGGGVLAVNTTTGKVSGFVVANAFATPTTEAHVHTAARGTPGNITIPLSGVAGGTGPSVWVVPDNAPALTATQIADFNAGSMYFNIHTQAKTGGEIRGQIDKSGTGRLASLDGTQETPPTGSSTVGGGILAVDVSKGQVSGFVVTSGFATPTTQAHVHTAARGTPGNITIPLTGAVGVMGTSTVWVVPDSAAALTLAQIADFVGGNLYFNVHTQANTGGEIRGQIDRDGTVRLASLDGTQETPPTGSSAVGGGILAVGDLSGEAAGFVATIGLMNTTQAHVHTASRGTPGNIIIPLSGGANSSVFVVPDSATATVQQRADFTAGNLYYNVHTQGFPNGEIRGQIDHP